VTGSDHTYFVLPPADIPAFIDNNKI
jgi:hypothetical protein